MSHVEVPNAVEYYADSLDYWSQDDNIFHFHSRNGVI